MGQADAVFLAATFLAATFFAATFLAAGLGAAFATGAAFLAGVRAALERATATGLPSSLVSVPARSGKKPVAGLRRVAATHA